MIRFLTGQRTLRLRPLFLKGEVRVAELIVILVLLAAFVVMPAIMIVRRRVSRQDPHMGERGVHTGRAGLYGAVPHTDGSLYGGSDGGGSGDYGSGDFGGGDVGGGDGGGGEG